MPAAVLLLSISGAVVLWSAARWVAAGRPRRLSYFELTAAGERPSDLAVAAAAAGALLTRLSATRRWRNAGIVIWRTYDAAAGTGRVVVAVYGRCDHQAAADQLAAAVGAGTPTPVDGPGVPPARHVAATVRGDYVAGDDRSAGLDGVAAFAGEEFDRAGGDGWLAVRIEPMRSRTERLVRNWIVNTSGSEGSRRRSRRPGQGPVAWAWASAGATTAQDAATLAGGWVSHLPGWDFRHRTRRVTSISVTTLAAGAAAAAVACAGLVLPIEPGVVAGVDPAAVLRAVGLAGLAAVVLWAVVDLPARRARNAARWGWVPGRAHRIGGNRLWRTLLFAVDSLTTVAGDPDDDAADDRYTDPPERSWRLPYPARMLPITAAHTAVAAVPAAAGDVTAGPAAVTERPAPAAVRQVPATGGARLGRDVEGRTVRVPDGDRYAGVFASGDPGTGKTVTLLNVWGSDIAARRRAVAAGGESPATDIWVETKGSGAARALTVASQCDPTLTDDDIIHIDIARPDLARLDFTTGNPIVDARRLADAMAYGFADGAIKEASRAALIALISHALVNTVDDAAEVGEPEHNVMRLALLLAGGEPDTDKAAVLHQAVAARCGDLPGGPAASYADRHAATAAAPRRATVEEQAMRGYRLYAAKPAKDRDALFAAPLNKLAQLEGVEALFARSETVPTWKLAELVKSGRVVVINVGGSTPEFAQLLASMILWLLWDTIRRECAGWQTEGRSVGVFADEVADLARADAKILEDIADQGRDRGVRLALATQRIDKLPDDVARAVAGFGTKIYLKHEAVDVAEAAVRDLTGGDPNGPWTVNDIRGLPTLTGVARVRVDSIPQQAFTVTAVPDPLVTADDLLAP